jgi:hypothetical protein
MCGSVCAPQFGQATVAAALVFQAARLICVFARDILYFGSAMVSSISIDNFA